MAGFFPWPACHLPSCPCVTRIRYGGMAEAALHSPYHGQGGRRTRHLELRRRVLIEGKIREFSHACSSLKSSPGCGRHRTESDLQSVREMVRPATDSPVSFPFHLLWVLTKVGQRADENRRQCKEFGAARFLDQVIEPFLLEKGFVATSPGNAPGRAKQQKQTEQSSIVFLSFFG
ncbi:unnamed protein product [Effrenium voratum]|nr:unnamed protein product [Effrenium voratum]